MPWFLVASQRGMYVTAFVLFLSAAVTDTLDGIIARQWNMRSRLGALLDPVADKLLMVCGFVYYTFGEVPFPIPGWLTFTVFARDFLIAFFAYLMFTRVQITRFPPTIYGKASTVLQAVTLIVTIAVNGFLPALMPVAKVLFTLTMLLTLFSGWHYAARAERLIDPPAPARA